MTETPARSTTAFEGDRLLHTGPLAEVALAVKAASEGGSRQPLLVFDNATGRVIDLDLRGTDADVVARLARPSPEPATGTPVRSEPGVPTRRGPGRPKLGVVAREVTLLPRHWAWLAAQPSGASAALRRLVDEARKRTAPQQERRAAQEAAYRFLSAVGGDRPGYEEATRALFADDRVRFEAQVAGWPEDVRGYAVRLAFPSDHDQTLKNESGSR